MNDYHKLTTLKRLESYKRAGDRDIFKLFEELNNMKDKNSKNIVIVCETVKGAKEAMKLIALDYIDKCTIHKFAMYLEFEDRNVYFIPMSRISELVEIKYKEYYMEGMLNETKGKVF